MLLIDLLLPLLPLAEPAFSGGQTKRIMVIPSFCRLL